MEPLINLVADFVAKHGPSLDHTYAWPIPAVWPDCDFERGIDRPASANRRLRSSLSNAWQLSPAARADIERWYVAVWGGVRANRLKTLALYAANSNDELLKRGLSGVASWSKILAIRDCSRYAIYDARVAAALNALQIVARAPALRFPQIPSRNTTIRPYQLDEKKLMPGAVPIPRRAAYSAYLAVIGTVRDRLALDHHDIVEMTLFANAENLAKLARAAMHR